MNLVDFAECSEEVIRDVLGTKRCALIGEMPCGIPEVGVIVDAVLVIRNGGHTGEFKNHIFVEGDIVFVDGIGVFHGCEGEENLTALCGDIAEELGERSLFGQIIIEVVIVVIQLGIAVGKDVTVFGGIGSQSVEILERCARKCGAVGCEGREEVIVVGEIQILHKAVIRFTEIPESAGAIGGTERPGAGFGAPKNDITLGDEFFDDVKIQNRGDICVFAEVNDLVFAVESRIDDSGIVAVERAGAADDDDLFLILCPHEAVEFCRAAGGPVAVQRINGVDINGFKRGAILQTGVGKGSAAPGAGIRSVPDNEGFKRRASVERILFDGLDGFGHDDLLDTRIVQEGARSDLGDGLSADRFGDGDGFGSAVVFGDGAVFRHGEIAFGRVFSPYAVKVESAAAVGIDSAAEGYIFAGAVSLGIVADEGIAVSCEGAVILKGDGVQIEYGREGILAVEAAFDLTAVCVVSQMKGTVYKNFGCRGCGKGVGRLRGNGRFAVCNGVAFREAVEGVAVLGGDGDGDVLLGAYALGCFVRDVNGVRVVAKGYVFADGNAFKVVFTDGNRGIEGGKRLLCCLCGGGGGRGCRCSRGGTACGGDIGGVRYGSLRRSVIARNEGEAKQNREKSRNQSFRKHSEFLSFIVRSLK